MQQGMRDRNGEQVQGLRELMQKLRQERQQRLDQHDLGGVYQEIADALDDIIDEERHAIDNATADAERSGDERRAEHARDAAAERNFRLDMLPPDLAGKVRELSAYDFESAEARQRFEELMDQLRQQLMQQTVDQMSSAMQNMSPQDMQRMKDMMAALNDMIDKQRAGEDPGFEQFMEQYGDFFPENPQTLDELLEQMAQRMAAMQAMMNSMTPEQRAQLQQLSDQLLDDMDLRWQMDQLGRNLQQMFPQQGWGQSYDFQGQDPMGMGQAMQMMQELGELDQLENLMRNATNPAALAEADMDRVRDLLGDDAADSLRAAGRAHQDARGAAGSSSRRRASSSSPRAGLRKIGNNALRDLFTKLAKDKIGPARHHHASGIGHERTYETKAVRVRRSVPARPAAHHPQRHRAATARARRCSCRPTTSRSSAPSTSRAAARC